MGAGQVDVTGGAQDRERGLPRDDSARRVRPVDVALLLVLVLAMWLPRAFTLDRFVTVDEHTWLTRSANFATAVARGDYAETYQSEHPGVTTMWAGAAALSWEARGFGRRAPADQGGDSLLEWLRQAGLAPVDVLARARLLMVVANTVALAVAYLFARSLLGPVLAFGGFLLLALDPFFAAHTQLLHLDGLMSSLMLLSLLAFLSYLQKGRVVALLVSAVAFGLSMLTKTPALFLGLAVLAISAVLLGRRLLRARAGERWGLVWTHAWPLAVWGLAALAVALALWPALWAAPVETAWRMVEAALAYASGGHESPLFFNGRIYADGQLGADFYAIAAPWRMTPVMLLGLVAAVAAAPRWWRGGKNRLPLAGLALFVAIYVVDLSLSSKKFDRYLLPVWPPLMLVAVTGWGAIAAAVGRRWKGQYVVAVVLALAVVVQAAGAAGVYPYYLSYYNPLLGGTRRAPEAMVIGWGEGLEEAADYLNQKPDASELAVASWYGPVFSYYFTGRTVYIDNTADITPETVRWLMEEHDYVVLYVHQWQRHLPARLVDAFASRTPEYRVWINGLEYARVYDVGAAQ